MNEIEIKSIYADLGLRLERCGSHFRTSCPFHSENTPSFFVFLDNGSYHCFGCQKSGTLDDICKELGDEGANKYSLLKIDIDNVQDRSDGMINGFLDSLERDLARVLRCQGFMVKSQAYDMFDQLKIDLNFSDSEKIIGSVVEIRKKFDEIIKILQ
ncbi:MAG: CHC2 zinc finger domain-containing protein [Candidatus Bathyarchaeota archaeon]|nr:CHC2 zinc finger domain-containing protein [Candidatus Bathyarchaeota archaeon]